jgi:hypothetical protein
MITPTMKPTLTLLTALLLAAPAHADLVAHLRFDGDLTHPLTVVAV